MAGPAGVGATALIIPICFLVEITLDCKLTFFSVEVCVSTHSDNHILLMPSCSLTDVVSFVTELCRMVVRRQR